MHHDLPTDDALLKCEFRLASERTFCITPVISQVNYAVNMANKLKDGTSPYLRQHADNPVDWWPWREEAFAEARERDLPILLSVGYAACHWCHVMAHESFEDPTTAEIMNAHCVPIKVDREERPDIDSIYMAATQLMTGQGGWPMTVWCTPGGAPFYCGTYFRRDDFQRLVVAAFRAWREQRAEVLQQSETLRRTLDLAEQEQGNFWEKSPLRTPLNGNFGEKFPAVLGEAYEKLRTTYDTINGGFGGAPKFPPAMAAEFLLRYYERTHDENALAMVTHTAEAMACGGMYDQLAGGFARYSVDNTWTIPHFEKMLYDNALLLRLYLHVWRITQSPLARRIADETAAFLHDELRTSAGGFASSLDADTNGVEGTTYVWTPQQLTDVLGPDDGEWVARLCTVTPQGTFEHGSSVLQLRKDTDDWQRWATLRTTLRTARDLRPQPDRDDKVVTAWNALAISALAEHGVLTGTSASIRAAIDAADLLMNLHWQDGVLYRTSLDGVIGPTAVLEDYGCLAEALCLLHQVTGEAGWLTPAGEVLGRAKALFADPAGGFFDTPSNGEPLFRRPREITDTATPAGSSALAAAALSYSALSGELQYRDLAVNAVAQAAGLIRQSPRFAGWIAAVAEAVLAGPSQIAIVAGDEPAVQLAAAELASTAWRHRPPGAVVVAGQPNQPRVPLLADRPLVDGKAAAYVCRGFVCDSPVTTAADLTTALTSA